MPSYLSSSRRSSGGGGGSVSMPPGILLFVAAVCCCMYVVSCGGAYFFRFFGGRAAGGQTLSDGTYRSEEIVAGFRGPSSFSASCPPGRFVRRIYTAQKDVGPHVVNKRHGRLTVVGVMCSDGNDRIGIGQKKLFDAELGCDAGMRRIDTWATKDAIQRIDASCADGSPAALSAMNDREPKTGSAIGDLTTVTCPDGMRISGVSGTYAQDKGVPGTNVKLPLADPIRSWRWTCSKK